MAGVPACHTGDRVQFSVEESYFRIAVNVFEEINYIFKAYQFTRLFLIHFACTLSTIILGDLIDPKEVSKREDASYISFSLTTS